MRYAWLVLGCLSAACAQTPPEGPAVSSGAEMAVSLTTGEYLIGAPAAGAAATSFRWASGEAEPREVPIATLLALHGAPPRPVGSVRVHLVGGDIWCGELAAGDAGGESFGLMSQSLGKVEIWVDRISVLVFEPARVDAALPLHVADRLAPFAIPDDVELDEALFRRARRGYDMESGAVFGFLDHAVSFARGDSDVPREVRYEDLAALALRGGFDRDEERPQAALLTTRTGDRVTLESFTMAGDQLIVTLEGGVERRLDFAAVSGLVPIVAGRTFLADLVPIEVEERAFFDDDGAPLWPHAMDRSVTGGALVSGGFSHSRGVGVHSRSVLTFEVPAGARHFHALVGVDDAVLQLQTRAHATARVRLDDEVLFTTDSLESGRAPQSLGLLAVRPGAKLVLEVDYGQGFDLGDRVDWLSAVFLP